MADQEISRKLAVIVHADVVGSTALVQRHETLAHKRINEAFQRFSSIIQEYSGTVHEIRGDALVAEFARASDAVCAALSFQQSNTEHNAPLGDDIVPVVRVGIALGEEVFAHDTVTGAGVVLAQRVEQLSEPGGVCVTGAIHEAIPQRMPFDQESLGEQAVKGFEEPVRVYRVALKPGAAVPEAETRKQVQSPSQTRRLIVVFGAVALVVVGVVVFWLKPWAPEFEPASVERMALPLPDKPSIAVLPFDNLSDHPQGEFLADGVTDTITAILGQVPGLFVISRNSAFTYKGRAVKVQEVSQELGVRYVLEGSVQRSGDRVRVTAQLVDATTDQHLWADRYDRDLGDIFALQDEIALKALIALQVELTEGEQANVRAHSTKNVEAYLLYVRALVPFRTFTKNGMVEARRFTERSLTVDPGYSSALILGAWTHIIDARFGYSALRNESLRQANQLLEEAELAAAMPDSVRGEFLMARAFVDLMQHRHENATALGSKAVSLAPNNSFIIAVQGMILFFTRQYDGAVRLFERAMRLSPAYPGWYPLWLSPAYVFKGNHERAIVVAEEGIARAKSDFIRAANHVRAAFAYADQGNVEKAKQEVKHVKEITPVLTLPFYRAIMHFEHEEDWQRFANAMRKAGLPD
jgi:TolB-like protein/class 3 adenylate cyclase